MHGAIREPEEVHGGQSHDRIGGGRDTEGENATMDISASQKMLSATSGSILTSLLGMPVPFVEVTTRPLLTLWSSHPFGRRPRSITISSSDSTADEHTFYLSFFQQASTEPRGHFLLSRSFLGRQWSTMHGCSPGAWCRLCCRRDAAQDIHIHFRWIEKDRTD